MRLIDADELTRRLCDLVKLCDLEVGGCLPLGDITDTMDFCKEYGHQDTVAVAQKVEDEVVFHETCWVCSRCKARIQEHSYHCPNCGARFVGYDECVNDEWIKE